MTTAFTIREGDSLPRAMLALPYDERPMIWQDVAQFAVRHQRTGADVVYDLALLSKYLYTQNVKLPTVAPLDLELLVRLYDLSPSSCDWNLPNVGAVFEMLYGPVCSQFAPGKKGGKGGWTEADFKTAELAAGRRYARLLGRADTATYRWVERGGKVTRRLSNILAKVVDICSNAPVPYLRFEEITRPILARRGVDIDAVAPLPTAATVRRLPGTIGRRISVGNDTRVATPDDYRGGAFG